MSDKFNNKYRIESARLKSWDYGSNAPYFVTICTKDREYFFGNVANEKMNLSETGNLANKFWLEIPKHFPYVKLEDHVVMLNHIHGIIVINKPDDSDCRDAINRVSTIGRISTNRWICWK